MSRDEQARELLRKHAGCAPHGLGQSVKTTAALRAIIEALRGASGGGADATAMERLRIMSKQKLASEMEDHEIDCADWRAGYEHMVSEARTVFASIAPDHPAENAKSSGEVRAASVAELLEMLSVANQEDGSAIFDHTPDEIGLHVMENHKEILAALARSGKGEG